MADKTYRLNVTLTDGSQQSAGTFTVPQGDTGARGPAGAAATIAVGTVTTGEAGSEAEVTNAGTSSAARFNFVIPRGDTGAQGPQGVGVQSLSIEEVT